MVKIYDGYEGYLNGPSFSSPRKNLGNKLFIYAGHWLLAEKMNCNLILPDRPLVQRNGVEEVFPFKSIFRTDQDSSEVRREHWLNINDINNLGSIQAVAETFKGYNLTSNAEFSRYDFIKPYKNEVKTLYASLVKPKRDTKDLVILLRSSNHDRGFILPDSYYTDILEKETFDRLYISYDHYENHGRLFERIKKYNPIFLDLGILDLFREVTSFPKIICSQGTFSFWAAFLSNADKVYWAITNSGPNRLGDPGVNLKIDDETRFEFTTIPDIHKI